MPLPPTFDARLVAARALSPSVRELTFERTDGAPFRFEAGQWVSFVLRSVSRDENGESGEEKELRRSYSIASAPTGTPRFDVAVTHVAGGPGSSILHALQPGACVTVIGPQGFFTRALAPLAPAPSLFVATGTGVTPFCSMLAEAAAAGDTTPTWLLFGVRHEEGILYRAELGALAAARPNVRLVPTLSRPGDTWTGKRGYVQAHARALFEELAAHPASEGRPPHAYICGLQRMVGSLRDLLRKEMELPRERVHTERYD
jgi:CDP-4-dehydro-6-deoxyglucose reductase